MATVNVELPEKPGVKEWRWAATAGCAPLSRKVFRKWLFRVGASHLEDDACVLFSELFANALRYPAPDMLIATRWLVLSDGIRVEVDDASSQDPVVEGPPDDAEHGRGLILVHLMSARWGVKHRRFNDGHGNYLNGKTVWFEMKA
ncbi:ATP-binding protein [Streptomyces prunicolor]|uniref:ATP-binding protein n=1 Tax=Streptomyces prunicolor TaxID=67348 RepID=UPI00131A3647|nr:ATP-binding protein [Streptomyces prunicolor]